MMINDDDNPYLMEMLIEMGVVEIIGFDAKSNQMTYGLTEKCQELLPELFDEHFKMINELAFKLWNDGLIEMTFDKDGIPMVMLTQRAIDEKDNLIDEERFFIENLLNKEKLRKDGII